MFFAPKYIVSEKYRFVYCFIPKVACTSIKTAIAPLFGIDTTGMEIPRKNQIRRYIIHEVFYRSEHQITKKQLIEGLDGPYSGFFKFGFVRNPWARLVSCYSDKIIGEGFVKGGFVGMGEKGISTFYRNMPFDEFVEAVYATPDVKADIHFRSQHWNMCHRRGAYIADYIGRFENLAEDFSHVEEQIGVKLELPHMLHSRKDERHYTRYYTNKLRDLVGERYRTDVELFGYSFGSPEPPLPLSNNKPNV